MSQDKIDAFARSAAEARKDMAHLCTVLTSRKSSRALSKNEMRRHMKQLFEVVDIILIGVDELLAALNSQPADDDEADLAI